MKINVHCLSYLSNFFRMRNVSDQSCREYQNTHFVSSNFFFSKTVQFMRYVEIYRTAGQATDDNMALAHCMLET